MTTRLLPDVTPGAESTYWHVSPVAGMNPFMANLLANWNVLRGTPPQNLIDRSAATPGRWFFLFFHEYAVYGGHLGAGGAVRTFFEDALGLMTASLPIAVTLAGGAAAVGATVTLSGPTPRATATDKKGAAKQSSLDPGTYTVTASLAGQQPATASVVVARGTNSGVTLILQPASTP